MSYFYDLYLHVMVICKTKQNRILARASVCLFKPVISVVLQAICAYSHTPLVQHGAFNVAACVCCSSFRQTNIVIIRENYFSVRNTMCLVNVNISSKEIPASWKLHQLIYWELFIWLVCVCVLKYHYYHFSHQITQKIREKKLNCQLSSGKSIFLRPAFRKKNVLLKSL